MQKLLKKSSQRYADNIALSHPDGILTYQDLHTRTVALQSENSFKVELIEFISGQQTLEEYSQIWACLASGKPFLPLNPLFPAARLNNIQRALKTCTSEFLNQLAYIIFTSGSTGEPKGVPITSPQLAQYCDILQDILRPTEYDRVLQLADFSFDISIMAMAIAWPNGASLYAIPKQYVLMAPRYAQEHEITIWLSVPSVVDLAATAGLLRPNSLPQIRLAIFGGEALSYDTVKKFSEAAPNARLFNFWGPTEGTISLSHFEIDRTLLQSDHAPDPCLDIIPIGRPHPAVDLALWNSEECAFSNTRGELCASSPQITSGYLNNSDASPSIFFEQGQQRWYRTGDLATWDKRYGYCYQGRIDRQVKIKGYRIELQECELALKKASSSEQVCVIPWVDQSNQQTSDDMQELVGFIVGTKIAFSNDLISLRVDSIKGALQELLPSYMIPSRILFIDAMPLNPNGKLDYKAMEALVSGNIQ